MIQDREIFRPVTKGAVEIYHADSPIVRLTTNGEYGDPDGIPLDAGAVWRLAFYLDHYATRLCQRYPAINPGGRGFYAKLAVSERRNLLNLHDYGEEYEPD